MESFTMATSTGKAARRRMGNRYDCKRSNRRRNPIKIARWNEMEKERKRKEKHSANA
jgi:hypothetical protein